MKIKITATNGTTIQTITVPIKVGFESVLDAWFRVQQRSTCEAFSVEFLELNETK